ncbi:MAG: hypothetical protein E6H63_09320 [Betaproteobacteria bacterium]|nr:MAG: hypothetical protein E6H63_09320 [Betaproteobacteria bacterium]
MRTFYVRPQCEAGYGTGDGVSYENAWNGLASVDWDALAALASAMVLVCGDPAGRDRLIALRVDWSDRAALKKAA